MRLVILTNRNSTFGKKVIDLFNIMNIETEIITIGRTFKYYLKQFNSLRKRIGLIQTIYFSYGRLLGKKKCKYTKETYCINKTKIIDILKEINPDIIILAQAGIVRRDILEIPKIGVINSHSGILPYYRGIDCSRWAIYNNDLDKIGCTIHWVDEGIDTGNIIKRKRYNINNIKTLKELDKKIEDLCIITLCEVIKELETKMIIGEKQEEGKQYYKMDFWKELKIKNKINKEGLGDD